MLSRLKIGCSTRPDHTKLQSNGPNSGACFLVEDSKVVLNIIYNIEKTHFFCDGIDDWWI